MPAEHQRFHTPATRSNDLAGSVHNLAIWLGEAGRRAEALAEATEAVYLYRRLATKDPLTHNTDLIRSEQVLAWLQGLEGA